MNNVLTHSFFSDFDIELFKAGKHYKLYEKLGAHCCTLNNQEGTYFAVWAPSAKKVAVIGDFNQWNDNEHILNVRWDSSGIWEGFIPNVGKGSVYKFKIFSNHNNYIVEKADPFAFRAEHPPKTASIVWNAAYQWKDQEYLKARSKAPKPKKGRKKFSDGKNSLEQAWSVYEVHLGSWMIDEKTNKALTYKGLAKRLVEYVKSMGYTHVEFMPLAEYPYDPSWGYQITGYFAPSSRFGYPEDFKALIDALHLADIGVIMDWVPSHFPEDLHGLGYFDGTHLYEHPDRRRGYHPDWKSLIFNYGRNEVKSFLISNALYWLDHYHIDALRVDAVASMLYLDYSRNEGEWEPNIFGGRENLESIAFLKEFNSAVYQHFPEVQTIAEESTSYPMVSKPVSIGGLGFGMKWMMGWMHDTLEYFKKEPIYRKHHHNELSFSMTYAFTENFMLPFSHDEVVYGKRSILGRMPGDDWQKFANLRLLYAYMFSHSGTKLLFMGADFGQHEEWNFTQSLDWHLLEYEPHQGINKLIKTLNKLYKTHPALYEQQFNAQGFEWIILDDSENSVYAYLRKSKSNNESLLVVLNCTPVPRENYRIGVPFQAKLKLLLDTDAKDFGGSDYVPQRHFPTQSEAISWNGKDFSIALNLPPLAALYIDLKQ